MAQKAEMDTKAKENIKLVNKDPKIIRAPYDGRIYIRHTEEHENCYIIGCVMLDPCRIAIVDWKNESKTILYRLKLSTKVWDIICIDPSQLVVVTKYKLIFVAVGQRLMVKTVLEVDGFCKGIHCSDNQLYVSFVSPEPAVKKISRNGEILETFSTDQNGKPLYESPWQLCLSRDKNTLFVIDRGTESLKSLDLHRPSVQNCNRDSNLELPHGLAVDIYDNVYISGGYSDNIHQISTQCRPIQILLDKSQGLVYPRTMA